MLILYLLGVCLIFAIGLFADDALHGRSLSLAWRALGAVLWPVALPLVVGMGILARRRRSTSAEGDRPPRRTIGQKDERS